MRKIAIALGLLAMTLACTQPTAPAQAQASKRTFVSAAGNDANASLNPPCQVTTPCRTFGAAYAQTIPDGEINVLDPAGYGTLNITHGLSIVGHGWAAITAQAGNAITINAGVADKINLRGLLIDGAGTGVNGIVFNSGHALVVEDTTIRNFSTNGIAFTPNNPSTFAVAHTTISDNGVTGILVKPSSSVSDYGVVLTNVRMLNQPTSGLTIDSSLLSASTRIDASAIDCVVSGPNFVANTAVGYQVISPIIAFAILRLSRSASVNTFYGATVDGSSALLILAGSDLSGSGVPWNVSNGGKVTSFGDNYAFPQTPPNTVAPRQ